MNQNRYFELNIGTGVVNIDNDQDFINLTELFRISDKGSNFAPAQWLRLPSTEELVVAAMTKLNVESSHIIQTRRGRKGGTWVHPTMAIAYAGYLDPILQIEMSEAYRRYLSGDVEMAAEIADRNLSEEDKIKLGARLLAKTNDRMFRKVSATLQCTTPEHYKDGRHAIRDALFDGVNLRLVTNTSADGIIRDNMEYDQNILEAIVMKRLELLISNSQNIAKLKVVGGNTTKMCAAYSAIATQVRMATQGVGAKRSIDSLSWLYEKNLKTAQSNTL